MSVSVSTLDEPNRAKLDGIVKQMADNGETEDNIRLVVSDFKSKYSAPAIEDVKKKETQDVLANGIQKLGSFFGIIPSDSEAQSTPSENDKIKQFVTGETSTPHNKPTELHSAITAAAPFKKRESLVKQVDEKVDTKARNTINDVMYGDNKDWKDPIKAIDDKLKKADNIDDFTALNHATDIAVNSIAPTGYDAQQALNSTMWGEVKEDNKTADLLRTKAKEYNDAVAPLRNLPLTNSDDWNSFQLRNAAIISHANNDSNFKDQLESSGLSLDDPNLWMKVGREKSGQLLDNYLQNKNVHDFLDKENQNPVLNKAFDYANKELLKESGQYGISKIANELSRDVQKTGFNNIDPIFNLDTERSRNFVDQVAEAKYRNDPERLKYYEDHKQEIHDSMDKPSLFEGVASGIKSVYSGIGSTASSLYQSRDEDIKDEWKKEASNVSADPEGFLKFMRNTGHATGFVLGLVAGGEVAQGSKLVSNAATAQKVMIGTSVFGDELKQAEMKFKSPVAAYSSAILNTGAFVMLSDALPASRVSKIFNQAKPELNKVAESLSSGAITKEVAREQTQTALKNAMDWGKKTLGQNIKASTEMTVLSGVKSAFDKAFLDKDTYNKYHDDGELADTFKSMFLSNGLVSGLAAYGDIKGKDREFENNVTEAANYPNRYSESIDKLKIQNPSIDAEQMKGNLKFLVDEKAKLDEAQVDPINQKRALAEALKEKIKKENIASLPESNVTRRTQKEIRESQDVQDKILSGVDVVGQEAKEKLTPDENKVIDIIKDKTDLSKEPAGSMGKIIFDAVQDPNNHEQVIKELVDQSSDPHALELSIGKKATDAILELPKKSEQKTPEQLASNESTPKGTEYTKEGGNKIVDKSGNPLVVYHGSRSSISDFDESKIGANDKGFYGKGFYFAPTEGHAEMYTGDVGNKNASNVTGHNIYIKNPLVLDVKDSDKLYGKEIPEGYDGVIVMSQGHPYEYVVKNKSQIKSNENKGTEASKEVNEQAKAEQPGEATLSIEGEQKPPEPPTEGTPSEADDKDVTSIKNEVTRLHRENLGLKTEIPAAEKEFGTTWQQAKDKIAKGYDPQDLVNELKKKARPLADVENALLLHHQNTKEIQLNDANDQINKAAESGNEGDLIEAKTRKARLLDELQDIYDVNKAVGTENARGLASRKMMTDRQYSLTNMIAEKRATANDGKPLSETQQKEVETLHKKITETQEAYDKYVKESQAEIGKLQEKILGKPIKDKKTAAQKLRDLADKIEKSKFGKADLPGGTQSAGIDINKAIAQGIRLVADGLEKGGELLDLIKESVASIKKDNPEIDEDKLRFELNKALIDNNTTTDKKTIKEDYAGIVHDKKAFKLRAEEQRAKNEFDINLKKDKDKARTRSQKVQDTFIKWQRAFKLSNPLTLGKLSMAALTRMTTDPLEQVVGGAISAAIPKLAKGSSEGGGLNIKVQAKAMKEGFTEGMKDAAAIMSKKSQGKSDLDVVFGKGGQLPPEAIEFFGSLHSAIKAPVKRFAFERSLQKRIARNIKAGVDVHDPLVQTEMAMGAYKDANRAIFMQDNKVATGWQKMVHYFETVDPKTGKAPAKAIATGMQWMLPFVKVPTNIAAEIGTNVYGVPVGTAKLLHATFTKGIENLSADEKDIILRNLKKGSLGLAALTLGYLNPQTFGGYYQDKEKRSASDAKANSVKLFGVNIPAWLVESPIFQAMEIGATVRRVKDTVVKGSPKGITEGAIAGALGLAEHVPMIGQGVRINKLFDSAEDRKYYIGELAKSTAVPALVDYIAKATDPADEGSVAGKILNPENKRKPESIVEHIESGVPGLRENVPEKPHSFTEADKKIPAFKYFIDKGLELPNIYHDSEKITDNERGTEKKLSDYSKDIQDKYDKVHKTFLKEKLGEIVSNGQVYVSNYKDADGKKITHISLNKSKNSVEKSLKELSKEELAQVLSLAQSEATTKTKKELFK